MLCSQDSISSPETSVPSSPWPSPSAACSPRRRPCSTSRVSPRSAPPCTTRCSSRRATGKAVNAVKLVQTYRTAGPAAALAELAALAAPATPKDGGLPPGAATAALLLAVALGGFIACAPVTAGLDSLTKTTLAERCDAYRAGGVAANALAASFPELAGLAAVDDAAVKALCGQPAPTAP